MNENQEYQEFNQDWADSFNNKVQSLNDNHREQLAKLFEEYERSTKDANI